MLESPPRLASGIKTFLVKFNSFISRGFLLLFLLSPPLLPAQAASRRPSREVKRLDGVQVGGSVRVMH